MEKVYMKKKDMRKCADDVNFEQLAPKLASYGKIYGGDGTDRIKGVVAIQNKEMALELIEALKEDFDIQ